MNPKRTIQLMLAVPLFLIGCDDRAKRTSSIVQPLGNEESAKSLPSHDAQSSQPDARAASEGKPAESVVELAQSIVSLQRKGDREGALRAMSRLMDQWSPAGLTREEVIKILGEPDQVRSGFRPNEMVYWLDTGRYGCEWTLEIRDGVVAKVAKRLGE